MCIVTSSRSLFFFKQKTAYELRISDWSSDVCSFRSFVPLQPDDPLYVEGSQTNFMVLTRATVSAGTDGIMGTEDDVRPVNTTTSYVDQNQTYASHASHQVFLRQYEVNGDGHPVATGQRSEEHTSELQSLMRISYAVFCLNKK